MGETRLEIVKVVDAKETTLYLACQDVQLLVSGAAIGERNGKAYVDGSIPADELSLSDGRRFTLVEEPIEVFARRVGEWRGFCGFVEYPDGCRILLYLPLLRHGGWGQVPRRLLRLSTEYEINGTTINRFIVRRSWAQSCFLPEDRRQVAMGRACIDRQDDAAELRPGAVLAYRYPFTATTNYLGGLRALSCGELGVPVERPQGREWDGFWQSVAFLRGVGGGAEWRKMRSLLAGRFCEEAFTATYEVPKTHALSWLKSRLASTTPPKAVHYLNQTEQWPHLAIRRGTLLRGKRDGLPPLWLTRPRCSNFEYLFADRDRAYCSAAGILDPDRSGAVAVFEWPVRQKQSRARLAALGIQAVEEAL